MTWEEYFMDIAFSVSRKSSCIRRAVGSVVVLNGAIVSTGYNGTPFGFLNCEDGGCLRCADTQHVASGALLEDCLCVHAEANAITQAAMNGCRTQGSILYSTLQPCIACLKLCIQAGVSQVLYCEDYGLDLEHQYMFENLASTGLMSVSRVRV